MQLTTASIVLLAASAAVAQPLGKHVRREHHHNHNVIKVVQTQTVTEYAGEPTTAAVSPAAPSEPAIMIFDSEATGPAESKPAAAKAPEDLAEAPGVQKPTSSGSGVDRDFPDGQLSCNQFPSEYGAIKTPWVTKEGWSGLQFDEFQQATGETRLANGDQIGECKEGYWCSYACPPGYSKAQWPEVQPANLESVGGLKCTNGKLRLTRPESTKKLCERGSGGATIDNRLSKGVAVCRTDYPGSENMVIPIYTPGGQSLPLTVPYASKSYYWDGKPTSAQYYVNNAGVSLEEGCTWGREHGGKGNWSPLVFGAGVNEQGETFVSLFQNPLNPAKLNFNVRIDTGSSGDCKYENGVFSGSGVNPDRSGCTASASACKFVFY